MVKALVFGLCFGGLWLVCPAFQLGDPFEVKVED
jgi:hypothetical protein